MASGVPLAGVKATCLPSGCQEGRCRIDLGCVVALVGSRLPLTQRVPALWWGIPSLLKEERFLSAPRVDQPPQKLQLSWGALVCGGGVCFPC